MIINILVYYGELLKKCSEIWDKVKDLLKKEFDSEQVHNGKYIKTKIKIYNNRMYTSFRYNKIQKDNEYCTCLYVTLLDSIFVNSNKEIFRGIEICAKKEKDNK